MSDSDASRPPRVSPKVVIEYPLPGAKETHEIVSPAPGLLLISQQTDGTILKVALDPATRRPKSAFKSVMTTPWSGLHGLGCSTAYPGMVWATLQFESVLLLLDPVADKPNRPPQILERIPIPAPGHGPHVVVEDGANLWVSCKDSGHVVRISHAKPADYDVWPTSPRPVFVAVHPTSGDVYAGLDKSSRIFRLQAKSGKTSETAIDPAMGSTPVGVVRGADGNVWFVLLGDKTGGSGTFGRIGADGAITWFHLGNSAGMHAGLIHLGFGEPEGDGPATLYLLGSTMGSMMALDAVFKVTFDPGHSRIATVQTVAMATPMCMTHRVLPMGGDVFVTAMVCALTRLTPSGSLGTEIADYFADFGVGQPAKRVVYTDPARGPRA
jgi:streptogramin lyase